MIWDDIEYSMSITIILNNTKPHRIISWSAWTREEMFSRWGHATDDKHVQIHHLKKCISVWYRSVCKIHIYIYRFNQLWISLLVIKSFRISPGRTKGALLTNQRDITQTICWGMVMWCVGMLQGCAISVAFDVSHTLVELLQWGFILCNDGRLQISIDGLNTLFDIHLMSFIWCN